MIFSACINGMTLLYVSRTTFNVLVPDLQTYPKLKAVQDSVLLQESSQLSRLVATSNVQEKIGQRVKENLTHLGPRDCL